MLRLNLRRVEWTALLGLWIGMPPAWAAAQAPGTPRFEVTFPAGLHAGPIDARVYVLLAPATSPAPPRLGPDWFHPEPFFAVEARGWKPGEPLAIGPEADGYPVTLDRLDPGAYQAQAVVRLNPDTHDIGTGEGNAYGPVVPVRIEPGGKGVFALTVDTIVPPRRFPETDRVKLVDIPSPLLSKFHGRPIRHRAGIVLPREALELDPASSIRWPSLYLIPGFGGDHFGAVGLARREYATYGESFVRVMLDPDCGTGHHVFADSATNGPRGQALIEELIPYIEAHFPVLADPGARLVSGHSSGGWSSLWLQVRYPDQFGGVWSTAPDPVDFRDFQQADLYAPGANLFRDAEGNRRPVARRGTRPVLWFDDFSKMEQVIGPGGQLASFEAVFSPKGPDGQPRRLWDRATGAVDPETARAWEPYDIRLVLERNWDTLGPKLAGKLHVYTGSIDTFYLEGAVRLLDESLGKLGSDAEVEIVPGRNHGDLIDPELAGRIDRSMRQAVARFRPDLAPRAGAAAEGARP